MAATDEAAIKENTKRRRIHAALLKFVEIPKLSGPLLTRDLDGLINTMMIPELVESDDGRWHLDGLPYPSFVSGPCGRFLCINPSLEIYTCQDWSSYRTRTPPSFCLYSDGEFCVSMEKCVTQRSRGRIYSNGTIRPDDLSIQPPLIPSVNEFGELSGPLPSDDRVNTFLARVAERWKQTPS